MTILSASRFAWLAAFSLASLVSSAAMASTAKPADSTLSDRYRAYLAQCQAAHVCNGTYLIARNGRPVYVTAIGDAGDPARTALTTASQFDIGSISKQFTAVAVVKLARQGRFALSDRVASHLPAFPYPEITIEQLLSHTSGMPDVLGYYSDLLRSGKPTGPLNGADIVEVLTTIKRPTDFAPGARYSYNNSGYLVLAALVEAKANQPFDQYLERNFFKPLRMTSTLLRTPQNEALITNRAMGFRPGPTGDRRPADQIPGFFVRGAGGIYSTVDDLLRWQNALTGGKLLTASEWRRATTPARLTDGSTAPYGHGMALRKSPLGVLKIGHGGHYRGFKSELAYYPAARLTVIQLTNNWQDHRLEANATALQQIAQGETPAPVLASIDREVYNRAMTAEPAAVRTWFSAQLAAIPASFEVKEADLNALGYTFLKAADHPRAVLVFALTVEAFPRSANAHDSLAEAYAEQGDLKAALGAAQTALSLDPANKDIQQRIKELNENAR